MDGIRDSDSLKTKVAGYSIALVIISIVTNVTTLPVALLSRRA